MSLIPQLAASAAGLAALAGATTYALINPRSQIFGPVLVAPPTPDQVALTFDDGPNPTATPLLLEVLARHHVRATFFLIGDHAHREPTLTREISAQGHVIGNHTMTHPWLPRYSGTRIREELYRCNETLEDILTTPVTLFRAPHGARRPAVLRTARALGLQTVGWNIIAGDWHPVSASTLLTRLQHGIAKNRHANRGTNIVLHDGGQHQNGAPRLPTVESVALLLASLPPETRFVTPPDWR